MIVLICVMIIAAIVILGLVEAHMLPPLCVLLSAGLSIAALLLLNTPQTKTTKTLPACPVPVVSCTCSTVVCPVCPVEVKP